MFLTVRKMEKKMYLALAFLIPLVRRSQEYIRERDYSGSLFLASILELGNKYLILHNMLNYGTQWFFVNLEIT